MLRRALQISRSFSGSDPYWTHLQQIPDKYPQYAHLHWHTINPLEIGKYAKYRSEVMFGDHIVEQPGSVDWWPEVEKLKLLTKEARNLAYLKFMSIEGTLGSRLSSTPDYDFDDDTKMIDTAKLALLECLSVEQLEKTIQFTKELIQQYKESGVRFTRESISEKTTAFLMNTVSVDQERHMQENMLEYLTYLGGGITLTEDQFELNGYSKILNLCWLWVEDGWVSIGFKRSWEGIRRCDGQQGMLLGLIGI